MGRTSARRRASSRRGETTRGVRRATTAMTTDDATGGDAGGATTTMTMRARRGNTAANSVSSSAASASMVRTRRASSRAMGRDGDGDGDGDAEARVGQRRARAVATRARGDGARGDGARASGEFCTTFVRARGVREASRGARARAEGSDTTMRLGPREVGTEDGTIATARDVADVADGGVDDVTCWMAFGDDDGSDACADAGATMGVCVVEATGEGAREASRRAGLIEDARGAVEAYEGAPLAFDEALFALHSLPSLPRDITAAFDAHECYDAEETVPFIAPEWIERPRCVASAGSDAEDDDVVADAFGLGSTFLEHDMDWMSTPPSPVRFIREPEHVERTRRARELAWEASEMSERARREATIKSALSAPALAKPTMSAFTNESAHDSFVTAADGRVFKIASDLIDDDDDDDDDDDGRLCAFRPAALLEDSAAMRSSSDAEESDGDHVAVYSQRKRSIKRTRPYATDANHRTSGRRTARKPAGKAGKTSRAADAYVSIDGKRQRRGCLHCGTVKTPQWRMGPEGKKTLCNACGVRHMKGILN